MDYKTQSKVKIKSPKHLEKLLDDFFMLDVFPLTLTHLYSYLNITYFISLKLKGDNPKYNTLLTAAENMVELQVIQNGFKEDKSFSKWYLERYTAPTYFTEEVQESETIVNITLDTFIRED